MAYAGLFGFGAQVKGIRGADAQVRSLKDVGEYDVWTTIIVADAQAGELIGFSYAVGGAISGVPAVNATRLETNMRAANQFVDESMSVYAIAIQPLRRTIAAVQFAPANGVYPMTIPDFQELEAHTLFRMHVGGDKPFAEGLVTWFAESGGMWGSVGTANQDIIANNVPTIASARRWEYKLPIGRIEKFWCELMWPHGSPTIAAHPGNTTNTGRIGIIVRLLGVRARGVQ